MTRARGRRLSPARSAACVLRLVRSRARIPAAADVDLRPPVRPRGAGPRSRRDLPRVRRGGQGRSRRRCGSSPALAVTEVSAPGTRVLVSCEEQAPGQPLRSGSRGGGFAGQQRILRGRVLRLQLPGARGCLINELTPRGIGEPPGPGRNQGPLRRRHGRGRRCTRAPPAASTTGWSSHRSRSGGELHRRALQALGGPRRGRRDRRHGASRPGLMPARCAFDFWVPGGEGLGGNNGVLSLYERPGGALLDGVLYSNRTSRVRRAVRGLRISRHAAARAEELVRRRRVEDRGGTRVPPRTVSAPRGRRAPARSAGHRRSADTDSAADWHIVPTRGSTLRDG